VFSGGHDKMVRQWDLNSGMEVGQFTGHVSGVYDLALSADGCILTTARCHVLQCVAVCCSVLGGASGVYDLALWGGCGFRIDQTVGLFCRILSLL